MSALGWRRAACGPSLYFSVAAGTRPAARRLWRVPSRPLGRRRAVCGSSLSMKVSTFASYFVSISCRRQPRRTLCLLCPRRRRAIDLGSAAAAMRFGAHLGTGSGKNGAGLGEEQLGLDGLGEDQLGRGTAGAAERPAGRGGAGGGRGGAGTKSGSLAASGSCAVWSPEAERRRE